MSLQLVITAIQQEDHAIVITATLITPGFYGHRESDQGYEQAHAAHQLRLLMHQGIHLGNAQFDQEPVT